MTLILTLLTQGKTLQVSDRLVTAGSRQVDDQSNKSLVFLAANALTAIAYTGRAYIDGATTDHWLAEQLIDKELELEFGMLVGDGRGSREDIGRVVTRIANKLTSAYAKMGGPTDRLTVLLSGIQWTRRLARPVSYVVANSPGTPGIFQPHSRFSRDFFLPIRDDNGGWKVANQVIVSPRGHLSPAEEVELASKIDSTDIDSCEKLFRRKDPGGSWQVARRRT